MSKLTDPTRRGYGYGYSPIYEPKKPMVVRTVPDDDDNAVEVDINSLTYPVKKTKNTYPILNDGGKIVGYCEELCVYPIHQQQPTIARWDETVEAQTAPINERDFNTGLWFFLLILIAPMIIVPWVYSIVESK